VSGTSGADDDTLGRLTVYAIAVVCYFVAALVHEGLGHAGTTALLGGRVEQITSASCTCDTSTLAPWAARAVFAGGCIANILTGGLALWVGRRIRRDRATLRYTAWLFGHVSLFIAAGYLMVFRFCRLETGTTSLQDCLRHCCGNWRLRLSESPAISRRWSTHSATWNLFSAPNRAPAGPARER